MSLRRPLAINAATQAISFLLTLISSIIVARILSPLEIGLFSVSVSLIAFAHVFRDFGIGSYLVQARVLDRDMVRSASTVMITVSWFLAFVIYIFREPASRFYGNAGVAQVLELLSLNFLVLPFGAPLLALLRRDMMFAKIAVVTISSQIAQAGTTIALALAGYSFMSMAWGALAGALATVLTLVLFRPRDALFAPRLTGIKQVLSFGSRSSTASLAHQAGSAAPDLILGRTLGFTDVAYFSRASGLPNYVMEQFANIARGVLFPAFAKAVRDGANLTAMYAKAAVKLSGITASMLAFIAVLSDALIATLFGPQWARSANLASFIACYSLLLSPFSLAGVALIASGQIGKVMHAQLWIQCGVILAILSSRFLTLEGVVVVLGGAFILQAYVYARALSRTLGIGLFAIFATHWQSMAIASLVAATSMTARSVLTFFDFSLRDEVVLAATALLSLATWIIGIRWLDHPLGEDLRRFPSWAKSATSRAKSR